MPQNVGANPKKKGVLGSSVPKVQYITMLAMLVALGIVLKTVTVYLSSTTKISFTFLPEAIAAVALGPVGAVLEAGLTDVIGIILFPADGGFLPQFTVSAVLAGTIMGVILSKRVSLSRIVIARISVNIFVYMLLNSVWMEQIYKMPFKVRIFTQLLKLPITCSAEIVILIITLPIIARLMKPFGFNIEVSENVSIDNLKSSIKSKIFPFCGTLAAALGMLSLSLSFVNLEFDGQKMSYSYYALIADKLFPATVNEAQVAGLELTSQFKYIMLIPIVLAACSAVFSLFAGKGMRVIFGAVTALSLVDVAAFSVIARDKVFASAGVGVTFSVGVILFTVAFVIYCILPIVETVIERRKNQ